MAALGAQGYPADDVTASLTHLVMSLTGQWKLAYGGRFTAQSNIAILVALRWQ